MKKTIKPSPIVVIILGVFAVVCIVISVAEFADTYSTSAATICLDALVLIAFGIYLMRYCSQDKIEFDEGSFTVGDKTYGFDEITNVAVNTEQVLRCSSTLRLKIYIGENEVCSFSKDDNGAKDFTELMERHGVKIKIY